MAAKIDFNCDMGESFGMYKLGCDEEVIKYITSANIACGFHAGDPVGSHRGTVWSARGEIEPVPRLQVDISVRGVEGDRTADAEHHLVIRMPMFAVHKPGLIGPRMRCQVFGVKGCSGDGLGVAAHR